MIDPLSHQLGELSATLKAHIDSVNRDREQAASDRETSANYRKEVRGELKTLTAGIAEVGGLKKRVDRMEPIVENHRKTLAGATLILTACITLVGYSIKTFGADIKAGVFKILRIQ